MALQGSKLVWYNGELVKSVESLHEQRDEMNRQMSQEKEVQEQIQKELSILASKLEEVNGRLGRQTRLREECAKLIQVAEGAYGKILDSSQTLLHDLRRDTARLAMHSNDQESEVEPAKKRHCSVSTRGLINRKLWASGRIGQDMVEEEAARAGVPVDAMFT
ncbi:unnamed protein product [Prorocentrum cordatum]|uniref:Uncharacterized protein n=1 Tax=Prorocentrum cordatum TaxID=2364126 RepID=A0ABN9U0L7_9DINO|nr:unnamed protein product [Polarella glacialis]